MYVEIGGESIGIFPDDTGDEYRAAGRLFFSLLTALVGDKVSHLRLDPVLYLTPDSTIEPFLPTGRASWDIRDPVEASKYSIYWDVCDHFVTLIGPKDEAEKFQSRVTTVVDLERGALGVPITTNWDEPSVI